MPVVQVSHSTQPYHIDDFKDGCQRSCKGALHFLPSSTKTITKSELEHVKEAHKAFAKKLYVVLEDETKTRVAKDIAQNKKATPVVERASHRPTKAQRKAAEPAKGTGGVKAATQPTMAPAPGAKPVPDGEDNKSKDKKKNKSR